MTSSPGVRPTPDLPAPDRPPVAARRPVTTELHGRSRTDDYDWLRAKDDPEVTAYLEAENAWTSARTAHLADLREQLFEEIKARTKETDLSVPSRNRGWWYYGRSFEGREYGAACRVAVADPDDWTPPAPAEDCGPDEPALPGEEVLLDHDALARDHSFYSVGGISVSPDGTLLAYSTDTVGNERYVLEIKDLGSGDLLPDRIEGVLGGGVWAPDGRDLYYCTVDDSWRRDKVWRHRLGTAQADDELVHHETDGRFWVGFGRSRTDRFLVAVSGSKNTTETRFLDTHDPDAGWVVFHPREEGLEYGLEHAVIGGEDVFLVLHNHTGPDFEIATAPIAATPPDEWRPLVPHTEGVRLEDVSAYAGHLVVPQRSGGLTQLRILELGDDGVDDDYLVEFPQELYTVGGWGGAEVGQPTVRVAYTSMTVPSSVYDYDVRSRELTLLKQQPVRDHDPAAYEEHRLWATADDGVQVPISLVCRKGAADDGPDPLPALRLRRLRDLHRPELLGGSALAARPRCRHGHRARARRRRDGPPLVRRREAAPQGAHVLRLRRLRPTPRRRGLDDARPAGRRGRLGRRAADRCGRQPVPRRCSAASSPTYRSSTPSPRCSTRACRSP